MQSHEIITAKTEPALWERIALTPHTMDIRDEWAGTPGDYFQYVHTDTQWPLGYARIDRISELQPGWTIPIIARIANLKQSDAYRLFGEDTDDEGRGLTSLWVYEITPCTADTMLTTLSEGVR